MAKIAFETNMAYKVDASFAKTKTLRIQVLDFLPDYIIKPS